MGNFRIVIDAVGGHGDDRTAKEGEPITLGNWHSPDKAAKMALDIVKASGSSITSATLTHWPGEPSEVVDDLVAMKRLKGQF